jgi:hypothetical protein
MPLRMLDSIYPQNLRAADVAAPADAAQALRDHMEILDSLGPADAYLGYVDGNWPTYRALVTMFGSGAHVLDTAVFAADDATGSDGEPGDMTVGQQVVWARRQLARGVWRPVCYRSTSGMDTLVGALTAAGIPRSAVRLLSAHYGQGRHVCGPGSCGQTSYHMDGTQWTDLAPGAGGTRIDESVLLDGFFGAPPQPAPPPAPAQPVAEDEDMAMIEAGTGAETIICLVGGTAKGIEFGCDAARTGQNSPWLRVAAKPNSHTAWQVDRIEVPKSGKVGFVFDAGDVGMLSVVRDSGGAADQVPVGYNLFA